MSFGGPYRESLGERVHHTLAHHGSLTQGSLSVEVVRPRAVFHEQGELTEPPCHRNATCFCSKAFRLSYDAMDFAIADFGAP